MTDKVTMPLSIWNEIVDAKARLERAIREVNAAREHLNNVLSNARNDQPFGTSGLVEEDPNG